jgi:PAS domain S-box-containing protein
MRVKDLFSGQRSNSPPAESKSADDIPLAFLGTIVESSDDAIISMTLDGHILSWNAGATRVFGYSRDEAIGRSIDFLIPPELHDEEQRMLERLRQGERIEHFETTRITKSGRRIQVSITVSPVRDAAGLVIAFSKIARDIDSAKRAERAAAQLAAIVESSEDGIISKSLDGTVQTWNAGAARIFGYSAEEMTGKPITTIIPPELHAEEREILDKLKQGERIKQFDTVRIHKDGRRIPVSLTISPIRDARGAIIGAAKIARDLTERMRARTAIHDSESRLAAEALALAKLSEASLRLWRSTSLAQGLDEIIRNAIALVGAAKGNVQIANPHAGTLSLVAHRGFEPDFLRAVASVSIEDAGTACGRAITGRAPVAIEDVETDEAYAPHRAIARQAGYRAVVSVPLFAADGSTLGAVTIHFPEPHRPTEQEMRRLQLYCRQASDFIQRFRLEQTLRRSEEALREADRRKDEFLALLAHELRNPLAPIRYAIAAIAKPGLAPEQQERAVAIIQRQVGHMSRLLDDLLDISRITRGTLELKKTRADLGVAIGSALEAAQPFIDAKGHALSVELPPEPVHLEADPVRLTQIFANLLINAAKYTEPGGRIQLQAVEEDAEVVVTVRDDGIGIPPELMPRLFTLFSQAHPAISRSEEGLGVGLALVRGLVSLHGGRVTAQSEGAGRGSEFCVRLPRGHAATDAASLPGTGHRDFAGPTLKILVVDDNRDAADSCTSVLELSGHEVRTAYSGLRALKLAEQFRPQAILLDIGLPDVTGYEVARQIRASDWGRKVPLVAITGWGQESDRRRAFEAGFDHHLTKPVAPETVDSLLRRIAGA